MNRITATKPLDLTAGDLLRLSDAKGTTVRVTRGTLWITQDCDVNDIVLTAGDTWTVERDGLTLVEAQADTVALLAGHSAEPVRLLRTPRKRQSRIATFLRWLHTLYPTRHVPYY